MSEKAPRISLGMPVYNSQRFLREVVDSILAQTFTDFELIISDNGSTDQTEAMCRDYAARDARVRYYRSDKNNGPGWNYNRTLDLARGEYFRWAASDDVLAPTLLERSAEALDRDPGVVLSYPKTRIIDENSNFVRDYDFRPNTGAAAPQTRFGAMICINHKKHGAFEIFGLIRTAALLSIPRKGNYARADSVVLARLALLGRFYEVPEPLFLNRDHSGRSVRSVPSRLTRGRSRLSKYIGVGPIPPTEWWDASKKGKITFPEWKVAREYWRSVGLVPLTLSQRLGCWARLAWFTLRVSPKLGRDVVIAGEELFWRAIESTAGGKPQVKRVEPHHAPMGALPVDAGAGEHAGSVAR